MRRASGFTCSLRVLKIGQYSRYNIRREFKNVKECVDLNIKSVGGSSYSGVYVGGDPNTETFLLILTPLSMWSGMEVEVEDSPRTGTPSLLALLYIRICDSTVAFDGGTLIDLSESGRVAKTIGECPDITIPAGMSGQSFVGSERGLERNGSRKEGGMYASAWPLNRCSRWRRRRKRSKAKIATKIATNNATMAPIIAPIGTDLALDTTGGEVV
jgi:hypothetical protein